MAPPTPSAAPNVSDRLSRSPRNAAARIAMTTLSRETSTAASAALVRSSPKLKSAYANPGSSKPSRR
jgi:hypothetical protein